MTHKSDTILTAEGWAYVARDKTSKVRGVVPHDYQGHLGQWAIHSESAGYAVTYLPDAMAEFLADLRRPSCRKRPGAPSCLALRRRAADDIEALLAMFAEQREGKGNE